MLTTGCAEPHTFGIVLAGKQVAPCPKFLNNAVVVRIVISCTYGVVNYVMRELEHDPCRNSTNFSRIYL